VIERVGGLGDHTDRDRELDLLAGHLGREDRAARLERREAQQLAARTEAIFVDHTYTAKAFGAMIDYLRTGRFDTDETVLFWHTGGQVGLFA
jgi:hypothetical protein